jgi:hypothetical protein
VPDILSAFNQILNVTTDFYRIDPKIKFHVNPSSADKCGKTDRRLDVITAQYHFSGRERFYSDLMSRQKYVLRLHVKRTIFLPDLNQILVFSTEFRKSSHYQFHENPTSRSRSDTCGQTDRMK